MALATYGQEQLSVYVFVAEKCPISIYMARPLQETYKAFSDQVAFNAVFPLKNSKEETAQAFLDKNGLSDFKIKIDNYQGFARKLEATITPEVLVLNNKGTVLYRGRISDAYKAPGKMKHGTRKNELKEILGNLIKGNEIPKPWSPAIGCFITFHN